ncbi:MAG: Gfo/Idh/MocA family protein [Candidatus Kapaibacterium sp.]
MEQVKISVIGTGHLGSIHAKLWKNTPGAELVGIYDIDAERAAKIAAEQGCQPFNSLDEVIKNSDAVTIAAPTSEHFAIAKQCIVGGCHCLIEKPITAEYSEARELIDLARRHERLVQVGHVERFNPAIAAIRDFGLDPLFIEAHRLSQFKPRAIDVSVIHDLMIHDIDIMLWMIKSPVKNIDANGVALLTDAVDIANARITFENGAVANLTASRISANPMRKMRLFQRNAYISIDFGERNVEVFHLVEEGEEANGHGIPAAMLGTLDAGSKNKSIYYQKPEIPESNAIADEQAAFVEAIAQGTPVPVGAAEAAEALRIAGEINSMIKI